MRASVFTEREQRTNAARAVYRNTNIRYNKYQDIIK